MPYTDIKLSMEAIEEFRQIWKQEFGEEISCEQAETRGKELVNLFEIIYRPVTSHHPDMCHEERKGGRFAARGKIGKGGKIGQRTRKP